MKIRSLINTLIICTIAALALFSCGPSLPPDVKQAYKDLPDKIDFNFHIRPILSDRCFKCHGPDDNTREADLRLDVEEHAFAKLKNAGGHAFVKGSKRKSIAWERITSDDPEVLMPPPDANLILSAEEKALIAKWIEQGAEWKDHWAFIPPERPEIPKDLPQNWSQNNPIDHFIQAKLQEKGLQPSSIAEKERLIRRLSFDLRGLPPSLTEIDDFLQDNDPQAYEKLIDKFMDDDAYAERMAMEWMDVSRFADSHGLHADGLREMWPWRDWVIKAFKDNLPYDDFIRWQIAGDLLPGSTRDQKLATGFFRNHPANSEAGIVSEEFRLQYVSERVNTTATAFMGLTMECAACHDHKFDPISQKEFYQMASFFNNINELGMIGNDKNFGPLLALPKPETENKLSVLSNKIDSLETAIQLLASEVQTIGAYIQELSSKEIRPPSPDGLYPFDLVTSKKNQNGKIQQILDRNDLSSVSGETEIVEGKIGNAVRVDNDYDLVFIKGIGNFNLDEPFSAGVWIKTEEKGSFQSIIGNIGHKNTGWRGWVFYLDSLNRPFVRLAHAMPHNLISVSAKQTVEVDEWTHLFFTYDGSASAQGLKIYINGIQVEVNVHFDNLYKRITPVRGRNYVPDPNTSLRMGKGQNYLYSDTDDGVFMGSYDQLRLYNQSLTAVQVQSIVNAEAGTDLGEQKLSDEAYLHHYLYRHNRTFKLLHEELAKVRKEKYSLQDSVHEVMVLEDMPEPRKTFILQRGQYDVPGEEVHVNTPEAILAFAENLPKNRLGLAKWLFDDKHPLTARVAVNRYWQMIFGRGIVETSHDFGSQGALPSHPELLDWLAMEFRESEWDVRGLLRLMLTSATYMQSSIATEHELLQDPKNIYLSKAPSYRLQAEMIRDNALYASGLLNREVGGQSVKPYQPEGLWKEKNEFSGFLKVYVPDSSNSLYRRSMYTFIRRTSPPPAMTAFDMPARDVCTVKRENTNTPLQALVIMNDPQFIEASKVLAERMQKEGGNTLEAQIRYAFRLLCGRKPNLNELALLKKQHEGVLEKYRKDPNAAKDLLAHGEYTIDDRLDVPESAALSMLANTIMNFDEAYMKR